MNASEAQTLADRLVADSAWWVYTPLGIKKAAAESDQWVALYEVGTSAGKKLDGPVVVLIDDGGARFLDR